MSSVREWGTANSLRLQRVIANDRGVLASSATAVVVRGAGALTNLLAMPIALHILGMARFGTFLVLFGLINWVSLGTFGVQSALGKAIASGQATARDLPELLGGALIYALTGAFAFALAISVGALEWMAITHVGFAANGETIRAAALMVALVVVQVVLQVFEGVQIGNLRSYVTNLTKLGGSAFTFVVLLVGPHISRSMSVFVVAISGGLVLGSAINAFLVARRTPPRFAHLGAAFSRVGHLAGSGAAFVIISLASLAETQGLVLLLASTRGAGAVVEFGLYIRLLLVYFSVVAIITAPLWPALISAYGAGDHGWARATIRRTAALVLVGGLASGIIIGGFGERLIDVWTHASFHGGDILQYSMGMFFVQLTWSHFWSILLLGRRDENFISVLYIFEVLAVGAIYSLGFHLNGELSIACNIALTFTNVLFPLRYICVKAVAANDNR